MFNQPAFQSLARIFHREPVAGLLVLAQLRQDQVKKKQCILLKREKNLYCLTKCRIVSHVSYKVIGLEANQTDLAPLKQSY